MRVCWGQIWFTSGCRVAMVTDLADGTFFLMFFFFFKCVSSLEKKSLIHMICWKEFSEKKGLIQMINIIWGLFCIICNYHITLCLIRKHLSGITLFKFIFSRAQWFYSHSEQRRRICLGVLNSNCSYCRNECCQSKCWVLFKRQP